MLANAHGSAAITVGFEGRQPDSEAARENDSKRRMAAVPQPAHGPEKKIKDGTTSKHWSKPSRCETRQRRDWVKVNLSSVSAAPQPRSLAAWFDSFVPSLSRGCSCLLAQLRTVELAPSQASPSPSSSLARDHLSSQLGSGTAHVRLWRATSRQ